MSTETSSTSGNAYDASYIDVSGGDASYNTHDPNRDYPIFDGSYAHISDPIHFYLPQLDHQYQAVSLLVGEPLQPVEEKLPYDVAYTIDIKLSQMLNTFRYYTRDISNSTQNYDTGYYITSSQLSTSAGLTNLDASYANPCKHAYFTGFQSAESKIAGNDNVYNIPSEFMHWIAYNLFSTGSSAVLFQNDASFVNSLQLSTAEYYKYLHLSTTDTSYNTHVSSAIGVDILDNGQTTNGLYKNNIAKHIYDVIMNNHPTRFSRNITETDYKAGAGTSRDGTDKSYPIPILQGDTFTSFLKVWPASTQITNIFGTTNGANIKYHKRNTAGTIISESNGTRVYKLTLKVIADNASNNNKTAQYDIDNKTFDTAVLDTNITLTSTSLMSKQAWAGTAPV